jgi:hypothetical protein
MRAVLGTFRDFSIFSLPVHSWHEQHRVRIHAEQSARRVRFDALVVGVGGRRIARQRGVGLAEQHSLVSAPKGRLVALVDVADRRRRRPADRRRCESTRVGDRRKAHARIVENEWHHDRHVVELAVAISHVRCGGERNRPVCVLLI